jgi:hypothetical protein
MVWSGRKWRRKALKNQDQRLEKGYPEGVWFNSVGARRATLSSGAFFFGVESRVTL